MELDLTPFCSRDKVRFNLLAPFSVGEYTHATDGRLIVAVPRRADVPERSDAPDLKKIAAKTGTPIGWYPLYSCARHSIECRYCTDDDAGQLCEICGKVHPCCGCAGTGIEFIAATPQGWIGPDVLPKMELLPGVEMGVLATYQFGDPMPFRFDGGTGVVMGYKQENEAAIHAMRASLDIDGVVA